MRAQTVSGPRTKRRVRLCRVLMLAPLIAAGAANARTVLDIQGAANVRVASNPLLVDVDDSGAISGEVSLTPRLTFSEAEGSVLIQATVRHIEYSRLYRSSDAVLASANGNWRLDPRTTINANFGFDDSIAGETGDFARDREPGTIIDDFTLSGLRVKRRLIQSGIGISHQPDARQNVALNLFASSTRVLDQQPLFQAGDYASYGGVFAYNRVLNERATVGLSVNTLQYECRSGPRCPTFIVQPELTGSLRLARQWTLEGSVGVSRARQRFTGDSQTTVSASGSLSICREDARTNFCLSGRREVEPTAGNGAQSTTSITSFWRYRVTPRTSISADVGYAESSGSQLQFIDERFRFINARISGTRQISERFGITLQGGYANSDSTLVGNRSNFDASIGISFSLEPRR
ncbi:MAG: hypothetical protein ACKVOP_11615 [Sphingomonadaceae bacterium]